MEFGIGVRGPECFYGGAIRWSKKFSDRFSLFDTIPAVTDSHPATQPASHVAVAITLNAKASSLKRGISSHATDLSVYANLLHTVNTFRLDKFRKNQDMVYDCKSYLTGFGIKFD